jgi:hypothetical protein
VTHRLLVSSTAFKALAPHTSFLPTSCLLGKITVTLLSALMYSFYTYSLLRFAKCGSCESGDGPTRNSASFPFCASSFILQRLFSCGSRQSNAGECHCVLPRWHSCCYKTSNFNSNFFCVMHYFFT